MINRREFISAVGAASLVPATAGGQGQLIKPPKVRPGDRVGLVSPATAAWETEPTKIWIDALESLGLEVIVGDHYYDRHGYFAGDDEARASDINAFFRTIDDPQGGGTTVGIEQAIFRSYDQGQHWERLDTTVAPFLPCLISLIFTMVEVWFVVCC